jgi:hypothetical protein
MEALMITLVKKHSAAAVDWAFHPLQYLLPNEQIAV